MKATKPEDASVWKKRVEGLEASGQSCRDYARRIGVNANTLAGWRWKLRRRGPPAPAEKASARDFVDVTKQVAAATGVIEVELGDVVVRVRGEVDGEMLARVLGAVGGRRA